MKINFNLLEIICEEFFENISEIFFSRYVKNQYFIRDWKFILIKDLKSPTIGRLRANFQTNLNYTGCIICAPLFFNLANLLSADENDQFWQIPTSFPDLTNQNGGIQI